MGGWGAGRAGRRVRTASWRRWAADNDGSGWEGRGFEPKRDDGLCIFGRDHGVGGD